MADIANTTPRTTDRERWTQLIAGVICMIMIANLQYGWTLFVHPIAQKHHWSIAGIQFAFSIFVALETWLTPVEGWIVDKLGASTGPKVMVAFGGITIAAGWIVNSYANSLEMLYLGAVLAGIGGGAALTVVPIREVIAMAGYEAAFFWFGIGQGVIVFMVAWLLRAPEPGELAHTAPPKVVVSTRSYTPGEILKSPIFWVLYIMFVVVAASGLM